MSSVYQKKLIFTNFIFTVNGNGELFTCDELTNSKLVTCDTSVSLLVLNFYTLLSTFSCKYLLSTLLHCSQTCRYYIRNVHTL